MNLPELESILETALETVVAVVNRAKEWMGERQTLKELAACRDLFGEKVLLNVSHLRPPIAHSAERLIEDAISFWNLNRMFMYSIKYAGSAKDETTHCYYYEVTFSQPTISYPIPQATATVFFRVQEKYTHPPIKAPAPTIDYRIEGQRQIHDIRYVTLVPGWLLAIIKAKITLYKRIENYNIF